MKFKFKPSELFIFFLLMALVGFTVGYFTFNDFDLEVDLVSEKVMIISAFGIIIPILLAVYIISKGAHTRSSHRSSR